MRQEFELRKWQEDIRQADREREERRIEKEEERRRDDLRWRAEQEEKETKRWKNENAIQKYQLVIVGIIGTIVLAATQIISAFIQAGYDN